MKFDKSETETSNHPHFLDFNEQYSFGRIRIIVIVKSTPLHTNLKILMIYCLYIQLPRAVKQSEDMYKI